MSNTSTIIPNDTTAIPNNSTTSTAVATGLPVWAIVLIAVGAGLVVLFLVVLLIWSYFSRQRRLDSERRLELARRAELDRAEELVDSLKAANRSRLQRGPCGHSYVPPVSAAGSGQVQYALCPVCFPQNAVAPPQTTVVLQPPLQQQPVVLYQHPQQGQPGHFDLQVQPVKSQPAIQYQQPQPQIPSAPQASHLRLANSPNEIPRSPPPVAPPGFITVPMVAERY